MNNGLNQNFFFNWIGSFLKLFVLWSSETVVKFSRLEHLKTDFRWICLFSVWKEQANDKRGDQRNFYFSLYFLFPCLAAPIFACLLCGSLPREPSLQTICKWYHYWNIIHFLCYFYHQSILNIGAMIGGPLGGWVIDFFGRKLALMITALPFSAGWLMIGFGSNEVLLHAGRFLSGLGVGMASLIVPVSKYVQTWKQSLTNFCLSS